MPYTASHDLVVVTGNYIGQDGKEKARFMNVGSLLVNREEGKSMIVLNRTFNPAGLPNPEQRDTCVVSLFKKEPKRQDAPPARDPHYAPPVQAPAQQAPQTDYVPGGDFDDDIPF